VARAGHGVLIFSLEMSRRDCIHRMAADACWSREMSVPYLAMSGNGRDAKSRQAIERGARSLTELPILIDERSGLKLADIASGTRRAAAYFERQGKRLGLVVVDHLGKVRPSAHYRGQKVNEVAEISDAMAHLAKAENVVVLALHQLNRAVEGRDNKRPTLADLRDSGSVEQDADLVLFAFRPAYYLERMKGEDAEAEADRLRKLEAMRNDLEIGIAKQRNGPVGTVTLFVDIAANAVRDKWRAVA
jgi:replicative DNA helicase